MQVNAPDVDEAVAFYGLLGMTRRDDRPGLRRAGVWLDAGPQQIHIIEAQAPADLGQHFALEFDDLDGVVASLRERGITVGDPVALGAGLPRQAVVHDPAGNRVELREPRLPSSPS